jgi:hypothetical protein
MLEGTLTALTRTLLPSFPPLPDDLRARVEGDVVAYVQRQIGRMPAFLRLPFLSALAVFGLGALARHLRPFSALPLARRRAYVNAWALSPLIPMRDFVKMVRSCGLLAWFDHPVVTRILEEKR